MYMPLIARVGYETTSQHIHEQPQSSRTFASKDLQFHSREVFIRREGNEIILSPRPLDWSSYLSQGPVASETFMEGIEDLPVPEPKV